MNIRIVGRLARAFPKTRGRLVIAALGLAPLCPSLANACACGCGLFDVGTSAMYANNAGGVVFLEYDFMDQGRNWSGRRAPRRLTITTSGSEQASSQQGRNTFSIELGRIDRGSVLGALFSDGR